MSGLGAALAFLTRIPIGRAEHGLRGAAPWFPLVGAVIGVSVAGVYSLAFRWMLSSLAAVLAIGFAVILTGALHEDGLADTADALGSGAGREEALQILRDPRLGTYGTLALVGSVGWRVIALASLTPSWGLAGLVLAHVIGRSATVVLAGSTPTARRDGLGRAASLEIGRVELLVAVSFALVIVGLAAGWWALPALALVATSSWLLRLAAVRRLGGITGDVLGASEQTAEMLSLLVVAIAAWSGAAPWWSV